MNERQRILLSPYRLPTHSQVLLNQDDMTAWLNGYLALWHPAALAGCDAPPRVDSAYDHDIPTAGSLFAVPESPPLFLPDDWPNRVREAGAASFASVPDRGLTFEAMRQALRETPAITVPESAALLALPPECVRPFTGLGLGHLLLGTLCEAMEHENVLDADAFWADVRAAIAALPGSLADCETHLRAAADKLREARETLYPSAIHLLNFALMDEGTVLPGLPALLASEQPFNLIAPAAALERLAAERPELMEAFRTRLAGETPTLEVLGGVYRERADALLPLESQLWNLRRGRAAVRDLLGADVRVFARRRGAFHPQLPQWLQATGLTHAILLAFDGAVVPTFRGTVVNWPSPDGRQVEAFARQPQPAHEAQTFFNFAHFLRESIQQDTAATLAFLHTTEPPAGVYDDLLALSRLAPVFGRWTTLSRYFADALAGEYVGPPSADEFFADDLEHATNAHEADPISRFARQARLRRRLDGTATLLAVHHAMGRSPSSAAEADLTRRLAEREEAVESAGDEAGTGKAAEAHAADLAALEQEVADLLAGRLLSRADGGPGFLLLNPCSYTRRVAVELPGFRTPPAVEGPVKAAQLDGDLARLVVEVPALGFAWVPRTSRPDAPPPRHRMRMADGTAVRNEFLEAEIDPTTGGLKALRDPRTRGNRLGQQLVFQPGSTMRAREVKVTSPGPAMGEIVTSGDLLDEHGQVLATFRQRFRAWLGRPVLDLRVELEPVTPPAGYPWHAYYAARFAWRDPWTTLVRGVNGGDTTTTHPRPLSPDYLDLRVGREATTIFPGGLPFHQKKDDRMLDVILIAEGETARAFELALALDRQGAMPIAQGLVSPLPVVAAEKGPPHVGVSGWLFHLDAPNVLLTSLRAVPAPSGASAAVLAQLLECSPYGGSAELRCVREPSRAVFLDGDGTALREASVAGDTIAFEASAGELLCLQIEFP